MSFRDDPQRLKDILLAMEKALKYGVQSRPPYLEDEMVQVWVQHHLQIIGEAANHISDGIRATHPEVPWRSMIAMRHILVHEYFNIDYQEILRTLTHDLPRLRTQIQGILDELVGKAQ